MQYNVSHLLKSPVGTTREYDLDPGEAVALDDEVTATVEKGHVRFDRTNTGILARGVVEAAVDLTCARCLDQAPSSLSVDFAEEFQPTVDVMSGRPLPGPENDMVFPIDERHLLELGEAIRQNLVAALPIQSLCRADCAGLCPVCGANRNNDPCSCQADQENRPLAVLAELLPERG